MNIALTVAASIGAFLCMVAGCAIGERDSAKRSLVGLLVFATEVALIVGVALT